MSYSRILSETGFFLKQFISITFGMAISFASLLMSADLKSVLVQCSLMRCSCLFSSLILFLYCSNSASFEYSFLLRKELLAISWFWSRSTKNLSKFIFLGSLKYLFSTSQLSSLLPLMSPCGISLQKQQPLLSLSNQLTSMSLRVLERLIAGSLISSSDCFSTLNRLDMPEDFICEGYSGSLKAPRDISLICDSFLEANLDSSLDFSCAASCLCAFSPLLESFEKKLLLSFFTDSLSQKESKFLDWLLLLMLKGEKSNAGSMDIADCLNNIASSIPIFQFRANNIKFYSEIYRIKWKSDKLQFYIRVNIMSGKKPEVVEKKVKDPVSVDQMKIFKQSVNKEKLSEKIYEDFQINLPQHLSIYTEKPTQNKMLLMKLKDKGVTLNGVDYDEVLDKQTTETVLPQSITNKLSTMSGVPKAKYSEPQTANQEIGWWLEQHGPNTKFTYPRKNCKESNYADAYYTMKHYSPFSNKNK